MEDLVGVFFILMILFLFAAIVLLIGRLYFYLKTGAWVLSFCDNYGEIYTYFKGNYGPHGICKPLTTDWIGFNNIANYLLNSIDVTVLFVSVAVVIALLLLVLMILIAFFTP